MSEDPKDVWECFQKTVRQIQESGDNPRDWEASVNVEDFQVLHMLKDGNGEYIFSCPVPQVTPCFGGRASCELRHKDLGIFIYADERIIGQVLVFLPHRQKNHEAWAEAIGPAIEAANDSILKRMAEYLKTPEGAASGVAEEDKDADGILRGLLKGYPDMPKPRKALLRWFLE